jgi:hypothetical protein
VQLSGQRQAGEPAACNHDIESRVHPRREGNTVNG